MKTENTKRKSARRSICNCCRGRIVEKQLIKAIDREDHITAFGREDDELVWVGTDGKTMCYGASFDTEHSSPTEWRAAQ
jgi:hypothetical protein